MKPDFLAAGLLVCAAFAAPGQEAVPAPEPQFEAASLKPAAPSDFDRIAMRMPIRMRCVIRNPVRFVWPPAPSEHWPV
jgi:hypothetical protein